jgi:hypothetical protein
MSIHGIKKNCAREINQKLLSGSEGRGGKKRSADPSWYLPEGPAKKADLIDGSRWTDVAHFPTDILTYIFTNLSLGDIFNTSLVNWHWNTVYASSPMANHFVWEPLRAKRLPHIRPAPKMNYRALCEERFGIQRAIKEEKFTEFSLPGNARIMGMCVDVTMNRLYLGTIEGKIIPCDLKNLKPEKAFSHLWTPGDSRTLIGKNDYLCSKTKDDRVHIVNLKTGSRLETPWDLPRWGLKQEDLHITDNNFLCTLSRNRGVNAFSLEGWDVQPEFDYPMAGTVYCVRSKGNCLYVLGVDRGVFRVTAWEPATGSCLYKRDCLGMKDPKCFKVTDDLLLIGWSNGVSAIDRKTGAVKHSCLQIHEKSIIDICVQGATLYAGLRNGEIAICDLMTGKLLGETLPAEEDQLLRIDVQDDIVIAGSVRGVITVWDSKNRRVLFSLEIPGDTGRKIEYLKIDGNRIYAKTADGRHIIVEFQRQNASGQSDETPSKK